MDWLYQAVLTAMTVAAVLVVAGRIGGRLAGLLAGLPVITVPSLVAMAQAQGVDFVARSIGGCLAVCVIAPGLAMTFVLLARRHGRALSLAGATTVGALGVGALQALDGQPLLALTLAAVSCIAAKSWIDAAGRGSCAVSQKPPSAAADAAVTTPPMQGAAQVAAQPAAELAARVAVSCRLKGEPWLTAAIAGAVVAAVSLLAARLGPYWSGALGSLPIILLLSLLHLQRTAGGAALPAFAAGYVVGVLVKAVFLCCFAMTVAAWGPASAGALAALAGLMAAWALGRAAAGADRAAAAWAARPVWPARQALLARPAAPATPGVHAGPNAGDRAGRHGH